MAASGAASGEHDPITGFLAKQFNAKFYYADVPADDEPEIKILLPELDFSKLHQALAQHPSIKMESAGIQAKPYALVNLGLDTYSRKEDQTRLIHKSGHQCRMRFGMELSEDGHMFRDVELNLKSNLTSGSRKEFEARRNSFKDAFNMMASYESVRAVEGLNFAHINPKSFFMQSIAMTSRAHGMMAHYVESHDCFIEYMICYDHTLHLDHISSSIVGEDCEAEYEARNFAATRPLNLSDDKKSAIIAESRAQLEQIIFSLSPSMIPSHNSKMGRSLENLAKYQNLEIEQTARNSLALMIHPDHFLGDRRHRYFKDYDFKKPLASIARKHLLSGHDIVNDFLKDGCPDERPLAIA